MPITPDGPASYPTYEGTLVIDGGTSVVNIRLTPFTENESNDDEAIQSLVDHLSTWPDLSSLSFQKIEHVLNTVTPTP